MRRQFLTPGSDIWRDDRRDVREGGSVQGHEFEWLPMERREEALHGGGYPAKSQAASVITGQQVNSRPLVG